MRKAKQRLALRPATKKFFATFLSRKVGERRHRYCLLYTSDISEKTLKNLRYEGDRAGVPTLRGDFGMEELGRACGMRAGVLAITDKGFAKAVKELAEAVTEEKEEHAHDD